MPAPNESWPLWLRSLDLSQVRLYPPARAETIELLESHLRIRLPKRYREFLAASDGAIFRGGNIVLFGVEDRAAGAPIVGTLNDVPESPEYPLFTIGVDANREDDIGFMRDQLRAERKDDCPLWSADREMSEEPALFVDSFDEFLRELASLAPGDEYVPTKYEEAEPPPQPAKKWWRR